MSTDLGVFALLVLMGVRANGDQAYGVTIRQTVAAGRGRDVSSGAIYTTLTRLEKRGLVRAWDGGARTSNAGRPRRYYRLTRAGELAVKTNWSALKSLSEQLRASPAGTHR